MFIHQHRVGATGGSNATVEVLLRTLWTQKDSLGGAYCRVYILKIIIMRKKFYCIIRYNIAYNYTWMYACMNE